MKLQIDGSADLMMNMVGTLIIMLAVFMPLVQLEQLTHLDNQSSAASEQAVSRNVMELALVEIRLGKDGKTPVFSWRSQGQDDLMILEDYAALRIQIQNNRPDAIRLRMDRQVPSGVMQDLVVDTSQMQIAIFQSNSTGK